MSARLRDAVRTLLHDVEREVHIQTGSALATLRDALAEDDRRLLDIEPDAISDREARITRLVAALQHFSKDGGHFVGCTGDKTGPCTAACCAGQLALERSTLRIATDTVATLEREIVALKRDWRHLRGRLHNQKLIHRRVLQRVADETGFVMRSPGRPRKVASSCQAKDAAAAATTAQGAPHETVVPREHGPDD